MNLLKTQLEKDVKNRIQMINEDIRRNLYALDLEESMDEEEYKLYEETADLTAELTQDENGLKIALKSLKTDIESKLQISDEQIALKVKKEDAVTELNIESGALTFASKKLVIDTPNFKVNDSGCYVNGTIKADTFSAAGWNVNGATFDGGSSSIITGGNITAKTATCKYVESKTFDLNPDGWLHDVTISNSKWQLGDTASKRTTFRGNMWLKDYNDTCNGGLESANGDIYCVRFRLVYGGNYTKNRNIIRCNTLTGKNSDYSDARLKENITDITEEQAAALSDMRPVAYALRDSGKRSAGLIAQEVLSLRDKIGSDVFISKDGGYYLLCYTQLIPLMVKQIQLNNEKLERINANE